MEKIKVGNHMRMNLKDEKKSEKEEEEEEKEEEKKIK